MTERRHLELLIADVRRRLETARKEEEALVLDPGREPGQFTGYLSNLTPKTWEQRRERLANKFRLVAQLERTLSDLERTLEGMQ